MSEDKVRAAPPAEVEGWEALAWHLCADENGEDACNELVWEGGPIPEPWGDRWLNYEGEAKRMIELVGKYAGAEQLRTAIAAEKARTADTHAAYCHSQQQFHDAVAELSTLRQQLAEAGRDAKRYRWLRRIDSFAEWNRVGHYAADALDAAIDAAIASQGEAK